MPLYYDLTRTTTTSGSAATSVTHLVVRSAANQETLRLCALYGSARGGTAGGASLQIVTNTATGAGAVSGGTAQTPAPRDTRYPAALAVCSNDITAVTPGTTLTARVVVGLAQTGGMGGWLAIEPAGAITMQAGGTNPQDAEVQSLANGTSVPVSISLELSEG